MKLLKSNIIADKKFYAGDSRPLYLTNLVRMPRNWIWRSKTVRYSLNSQGYRAAEWDTLDWNNSILVFGCSFTFGVGISDTDTCSSQLSTLTNKPVINLGMTGASPMAQWINSSIISYNNITPHSVIYMWPPEHRISELLPNREIINHGPWTTTDWGKFWMAHKTQGIEFLRYLVWNTSKLWNCPVLHYHIDHSACNEISELTNLSLGPNDHARDWNGKTAHPGPLTNRYWAETFVKDLNGPW